MLLTMSAVLSRRGSYHSQADSAGSIPVTRSRREKPCDRGGSTGSSPPVVPPADGLGLRPVPPSSTPVAKHETGPHRGRCRSRAAPSNILSKLERRLGQPSSPCLPAPMKGSSGGAELCQIHNLACGRCHDLSSTFGEVTSERDPTRKPFISTREQVLPCAIGQFSRPLPQLSPASQQWPAPLQRAPPPPPLQDNCT